MGQKYKKAVTLVASSALLCSCALGPKSFQMTLMARDSGKTYSGILTGNGNGTGSMTATIGEFSYSGPAVRVASNDTSGISSAMTTDNRGIATYSSGSFSASGDKFVKAILSAPNGHGLRCELVGRPHGGGGVCVDDNSKVYDIVFVPQ
jgi:hypothetical protein